VLGLILSGIKHINNNSVILLHSCLSERYICIVIKFNGSFAKHRSQNKAHSWYLTISIQRARIYIYLHIQYLSVSLWVSLHVANRQIYFRYRRLRNVIRTVHGRSSFLHEAWPIIAITNMYLTWKVLLEVII